MRHERQVLMEGWDQAALTRARVIVVGCGSLGSSLAVSLARLGVGSMLLMDPDVLEEHNLENQAYDQRDVGKPKVAALRERLLAIDSSLRVETRQERVQDAEAEWGVDCVFGCLDNVAARHFLNHVAHQHDVLLIDAGIQGFQSTIRTIQPGKSACYSCWPTLPQAAPKASCSSDPIPTTYLTAVVASNLQAMQFLKHLQGREWRGRVSVDLAASQLHAGDLEVNRDCLYCGALDA